MMLALRTGGGGENRVRATTWGAMGRWRTPAVFSDFCEQQQSLWSAMDTSLIFFTEKRHTS
jgi:hypothetical protein